MMMMMMMIMIMMVMVMIIIIIIIIIILCLPLAVFIALMLVHPRKRLKQIIQMKLNRVRNPNWLEANQLAIYKGGFLIARICYKHIAPDFCNTYSRPGVFVASKVM